MSRGRKEQARGRDRAGVLEKTVGSEGESTDGRRYVRYVSMYVGTEDELVREVGVGSVLV